MQGRWLVQGIVHSFGATRCIILHLVTSQSLQHAAGNAEVPLVVYSLVIAVTALFCIQVRCLRTCSAALLLDPQRLQAGKPDEHGLPGAGQGHEQAGLVPDLWHVWASLCGAHRDREPHRQAAARVPAADGGLPDRCALPC